jgi:CRISPR-associated protein Csb2
VLTFELELLTGAYRASLPDGSGAEWPPHPERLFSALVQAWGDGGREEGEQRALEWLEALPPPEIEATITWGQRDAATVFVPPNDPRGGELEALPERRRRQARSFQAAVPEDPCVRFRWAVTPEARYISALAALTSRVSAVGHSASLVRLALREGAVAPDPAKLWRPGVDGEASVRTISVGRLADLERWFADGSVGWTRPLSSSTFRYHLPGNVSSLEPVVASAFAGASGWYVFEDDGSGSAPDLLGFAQVARVVRDSLMRFGPQPSPEVITGHASDGSPSERPHLAIVPLASVGWGSARSGGDLLGFAVVLPREITLEERQATLLALSKFIAYRDGRGMCSVHLPHRRTWTLERSPEPSRASLRPARWCRVARTWASATPVLLDRFPDDDDPAETARLIAASCRHVGLPEPQEIEIHKHSPVTGAPSAYPGRGKRWPEWTFPRGSALASRPRRHVVVRFAQDVEGPVLLGAGRYHGFGLLLPFEDER